MWLAELSKRKQKTQHSCSQHTVYGLKLAQKPQALQLEALWRVVGVFGACECVNCETQLCRSMSCARERVCESPRTCKWQLTLRWPVAAACLLSGQ